MHPISGGGEQFGCRTETLFAGWGHLHERVGASLPHVLVPHRLPALVVPTDPSACRARIFLQEAEVRGMVGLVVVAAEVCRASSLVERVLEDAGGGRLAGAWLCHQVHHYRLGLRCRSCEPLRHDHFLEDEFVEVRVEGLFKLVHPRPAVSSRSRSA